MNSNLSDYQYASGWHRQAELLDEARTIHQGRRALQARKLERARPQRIAAQRSLQRRPGIDASGGPALAGTASQLPARRWRQLATRVGATVGVALGRRLEARGECATATAAHQPRH
ncbi:MAG TPA: hypothetical protein VFD39_05015 [Trueperaceae bacterium]|nr:hypothetical protein [Trueperaceae bacterium]